MPRTKERSEWNPTPEQRKRASDALLDLWENAEEWGDDELISIIKDMLDMLELPWVRLPEVRLSPQERP